MQEITEYRFPTRVGEFTVRRERLWEGIYWVAYGCGERLGRYKTAQVAISEVASGGCDWPGVINPGDLGISYDLSDWIPVRH